MSTLYQRLCDNCGKIREEKTGRERTPYDPDFWFGWIHISGSFDFFDMDGRPDLDVCCLKCLGEWAEKEEAKMNLDWAGDS